MGYFSSNLPAHSPTLVQDLDLLETENTIRIRTHVLIEKDDPGSRIRFKIRTQKNSGSRSRIRFNFCLGPYLRSPGVRPVSHILTGMIDSKTSHYTVKVISGSSLSTAEQVKNTY